jgi:DNA-binding response OmpR family regulator
VLVTDVDRCREIRRLTRTLIVIISGRTEELDAVVGLEVGADDSVVKPYGRAELAARIRAMGDLSGR